MSDNHSGAGDLFVAFGVGALVGAVAALLLAPGSGEETRRRVGEFAKDAAEKTKEGATAASKSLGEQGQRLQHAFEEGKAAYKRELKEA